jgi:thiamine pyrophosphokinase
MKISRAVILLSGNLSDVESVRQYVDRDTLLIGCDGGTRHILNLGLKPHVVIGDFDSYTSPMSDSDNGTEYIRYPKDKDITDSELAIRYAIERGCNDIILAGLLGDRVDHLLGNILLLTKRSFANVALKIIAGNQEIYLIRAQQVNISGKKGDTISFIPIKGRAKVSRAVGLKYDLSKYELSLQGNQGISNVLTRATAEVTVAKGPLLVIHERQLFVHNRKDGQ